MSLPDVMPTLLEVAGVPIPEGVVARSLLPILSSDAAGQVDPARTWVVTGRERHVDTARPGNLPYPMRALRTRDYVRNFAPDRWPMGAPADGPVDAARLATDTFAAYADMDAGPTKAWLVAGGDPRVGPDPIFERPPFTDTAR